MHDAKNPSHSHSFTSITPQTLKEVNEEQGAYTALANQLLTGLHLKETKEIRPIITDYFSKWPNSNAIQSYVDDRTNLMLGKSNGVLTYLVHTLGQNLHDIWLPLQHENIYKSLNTVLDINSKFSMTEFREIAGNKALQTAICASKDSDVLTKKGLSRILIDKELQQSIYGLTGPLTPYKYYGMLARCERLEATSLKRDLHDLEIYKEELNGTNSLKTLKRYTVSEVVSSIKEAKINYLSGDDNAFVAIREENSDNLRVLSKHRSKAVPIIASILASCTGIGLMVGIGQAIHSKVNKKPVHFLFWNEATSSQKAHKAMDISL